MRLIKIFILLALGFILLSVATIGGVEFTCSSWFCISCHEMRELGNNWKFSKHGPYNSDNPEMHNCLKCHVQPGVMGFMKAGVSAIFYLVSHLKGNYHIEATQPVVCIRDGCHQLKKLDKAVRVGRAVKFNHTKHIKVMKKVGTRYQCMPCHKNIAHGEEDNYLPDMKDCLSTCHTDRDITASNCNLCHPTHPYVRLRGKKAFLRDLHKDFKSNCNKCHKGFCKTKKYTCKECHQGEGYDDLVIPQEDG